MIKASLLLTLITLNTILCCIPLFTLAFLKLLLPVRVLRRVLGQWLIHIAEGWISFNSLLLDRCVRIDWQYSGDFEALERKGWYLVISNHQSWVDILVLQRTFNRRIPFLKFFLKQQLIWVPFLGVAWWALDFPFMKRYTAEQVRRNPALRGRDLETTRKACEKYRDNCVSIMNFVEGTRFTQAKHDAQQSPWQHLLKPRSGGIAYVIDAMQDMLQGVVDVTIYYPAGAPTLMDFLGSSRPTVRVDVRLRPLPAPTAFNGDTPVNATVAAWLNDVWQAKDAQLASLSNSH